MRKGLLLLLALCLAPSVCLAFSTPDVDLSDPVYRDIDRLVAAGLVDAIIVGQRPYSRMEVARIAVEAQQGLERQREGHALKEPLAGRLALVLAGMKRRFAPEVAALEGTEPVPVAVHPVEEARLGYQYTNSQPAHFIPNNGHGGIDNARIQPFAYNSQGRQLRPGSQFALETVSTARVTNALSFLVEPRLYMPVSGGADAQASMLQLYGRLTAGNASLTAGRKTVMWGQGEYDGLLLSNNAWPLDLVMLQNDHPSLLPSFLSHLGPTKAAFFYSDLGGTYTSHPGAYLVGFKLSIEPIPNLELGVSNLDIGGGTGAAPASLGERVKDVFSFSTGQPISNRMGGFEARLRVPSLKGANFYLELMFDDPNWNMQVLFCDEAAYLFGVYLPIVDAAGRLSLRAEYQRTGDRFYRHGDFPFVRKGDIIGDPLGPNAQAGYLTGIYDWSHALTSRLQLAVEDRGSDVFRITNPVSFTRAVVREGPNEWRYRLIGEATYELLAGLRVEGALGYERAINFNFESGQNRNNYYSQLGLRYQFDYGG
jgi:hypothetical protein